MGHTNVGTALRVHFQMFYIRIIQMLNKSWVFSTKSIWSEGLPGSPMQCICGDVGLDS